ncbi:MAG: hypothetical protein V4787_10215 [Pseudomonadota bacterium]
MNNNLTVTTTTRVVGGAPDAPDASKSKSKSAPPLAAKLNTLKLAEIGNPEVLAFIESDGKLLPDDAPVGEMATYCLDNAEPEIFRALMAAVRDGRIHIPNDCNKIAVNNAVAAKTLAEAVISCSCLDRFSFSFLLPSLQQEDVINIMRAIYSNSLMQVLSMSGGFEASVTPQVIDVFARALSELPELKLSWNLGGDQDHVRACQSVRDAIALATNITSFALGNCSADPPASLLQAIARLDAQKQLASLDLYQLSAKALSQGCDVVARSATITSLNLGSSVEPAKLAHALQASPSRIESLSVLVSGGGSIDDSPILDALSTHSSMTHFSIRGGSVGSASLIKLVAADTKLNSLHLVSVIEMDEDAAGKLLDALEHNSGLVIFTHHGPNGGDLPQDEIDVILQRNKQRALRYTQSFIQPAVLELVKELPNDLKAEGGPLGENLSGTWETPNQRFQIRGATQVTKTTYNAAVDARANDLGAQLTDMLVAHDHKGMADLIMTAFDAGIAIDPAALRLIAKNSQVPLVLVTAMRLNGAAQVLQAFIGAGADMDKLRKLLSSHCSELAPREGSKWYPGPFVEFCAGLIRCGVRIHPKHLKHFADSKLYGSLHRALTAAEPSTKPIPAKSMPDAIALDRKHLSPYTKAVLDPWATSSSAAALYIGYHVPPVTEEGMAALESDLWTWCTKSKNFAPMLVLANDPRASGAKFDCTSAKPALFLQVGDKQVQPVAVLLQRITGATKLELHTTCTGENFKLMLAALITAMRQNKELTVTLVLSGTPTSKKTWPDFVKKYGDRVTLLIRPQ